jgi:uncharacterized membrane protein
MSGHRHRVRSDGLAGTPLGSRGCPIALVTLVVVEVIGVAFTLAGLSPIAAGAVLVASLIGSAVDVPVARLATGLWEVGYRPVYGYGLVYLVPVEVRGHTIIAVNVGGAVIPTAVSVFLSARSGLWVEAFVAASAVAVVVHLVARPIPEVGIVLSPLVPALTAALVAFLLQPGPGAAALAYVAGTVGTIVGADLTHLRAIRRMRAPVASIGGAGTFDGVFVAGIVAVLLAAAL